jgi:hypothetical protein
MSRLRFTCAAVLALVMSDAAFGQDSSGGPQKSITPNSLSGTGSGSSNSGSSSSGDAATPNQGATTSGASTDDSGAKITGGAGGTAGGTPQGRNNTMDDTGTKSAGPGEGTRR